MPRKNFSDLQAKMSPARRRRNEAAAQRMLAETVLAELRQAAGLTQAELAKALGVSQANIARIEGQHDIQMATLRRLIEAMGAQLELVVTMPSGDRLRLTQFSETVESAGA